MLHMRRLYNILIYILLSVCSLPLSAEGLPTLKQAPEITVGTFPNGIRYYLVTNTISKGYADFAIVQKGRTDTDVARAALVKVSNFSLDRPFEFMASKGVGYTHQGYISYPKGAAVYRFEDVPVFDSAASDSTLLMIFDIARTHKAEQALVISGDINPKSMFDRLYVMSLTVGKRGKSSQLPPYEWKPAEKLRFIHSENSTDNVATITVTYSSPRTPAELMNTPQPLVTQMYAREFGFILQRRVEGAFRAAGIPIADISYRHRDSSMSAADETYTLSVSTGAGNVMAATETIATVLADLDARGASAPEFQDAKDRLYTEARKAAGGKNTTNREYVRKCVSSYLYGSNLASAATVNGFFSGKNLSVDTELGLFNNFVSALLDPDRALTLRYDTPSETIDREAVLDAFHSNWKAVAKARYTDYRVSYGDTLTLYQAKGAKEKLKASGPEPVTGGQLWTFSNGMKVIYKKIGSSGEFNYGFMLRGGYASVPGLIAGENAFVPDMLKLYDVAGMTSSDFHNMLGANGITMNYDVTLSDMRITGTAPSSKAQLLLRSLVSFATDRKVNKETFAYYKSGEVLRQELEKVSQQGINTVMDSIMCPDFFYPRTKSMRCLRDDLPERAEKYFAAQFSKSNDGVLILIGDLDEVALQKLLCRYLGGFTVGDQYAIRPKVKYQLHAGWSTYTIDAAQSLVGNGETCVNVAMSALMPFSMDSCMSFKIAKVALERAITNALASVGMFAEVTDRTEIFPVEKITIFVNCRPCRPDGLPEGIVPADPLTALGVLRSAISKVCYSPVSEKDLKGYKEALTNQMTSEVAMPRYLVDYALMRNSEGKDLVSKYKDHIKAVSAKSVQDILKKLDWGSKVEYVIK